MTTITPKMCLFAFQLVKKTNFVHISRIEEDFHWSCWGYLALLEPQLASE